jgi:hypothetical protein
VRQTRSGSRVQWNVGSGTKSRNHSVSSAFARSAAMHCVIGTKSFMISRALPCCTTGHTDPVGRHLEHIRTDSTKLSNPTLIVLSPSLTRFLTLVYSHATLPIHQTHHVDTHSSGATLSISSVSPSRVTERTTARKSRLQKDLRCGSDEQIE